MSNSQRREFNKTISSDIVINHVSSEQNEGIQVTDFIFGAIAQKYNHNNSEYVKIMEKLVVEETNHA